MGDLTLIDTDILIDAGRENQKAIILLNEIETTSGLAISVITQMELIVGCRNKFNIHAHRTWNCNNPLKGGQAVLQRRQA